MQTTLIILKPDAIQRGLVGTIINRFERKGLRIVGSKWMLVTRELAEKHYAEHKGKHFYDGLLKFITASPVLVLAIAGVEAVAVCRNLIGATNGRKATPGTIRGDYSMSGSFNLVHGSDSPESAKRELALWFARGEIVDYQRAIKGWVNDPSEYQTEF